MNPVLLHLLIFWVLSAVVLGGLFFAKSSDLPIKPFERRGVFSFISAAFGVVIGMTTFFASQHYADVRQAAQQEATSLGQLVALSEGFPRAGGVAIREQAYCYATDVIDKEWSNGGAEGSASVLARQRAAYNVLVRLGDREPRPSTWPASIQAALDTGAQRQDRLLESQGQIPSALWVLIYVGSALMLIFSFFFHYPSRWQLPWMLVAVLILLTAVVGVLAVLDNPTEKPFGLKPTAMETEQALIAQDVDTGGRTAAAFCASVPAPRREPRRLQ
jgi:hypothetical protein